MLMGLWVKNVRTSVNLTQKQLAKIARVSTRSVKSLEMNLPLTLEDKRRILTQLYIRKMKNPW